MLQAGGHQLIKLKDGLIIKPTKLSEVEFYKIYSKKYESLYDFIPKFYGYGLTSDIISMFTNEEYSNIIKKGYTHYIILENLLKKIDKNIIDIKLGSIHWKSDATHEIINNHKLRNELSTTERYKFRIDGYVINNISSDKDTCRNMTIEEITNILSNINKLHINEWIDNFYSVISKINLNIYGPSILIIYDKLETSIKLIDFTTYEISDDDRTDDILESLESIKKIINN